MSSFDAIVPPADVTGASEAGFSALCPAENVNDPARHGWRPLCTEPGTEGAQMESPADGAPAALENPGEEISPAFAAGYELGREEARTEMEGAARELDRALNDLKEFRQRIRYRYESELLAIALSVAHKIVRTEVTERPEIWLAMIGEAVRQAVDRDAVTVRVPRALAAFLRERMPEIRARLEEVKDLAIVEDPALPDGGCVIETRLADLDVGLDSQVDQVSRALTEVG